MDDKDIITASMKCGLRPADFEGPYLGKIIRFGRDMEGRGITKGAKMVEASYKACEGRAAPLTGDAKDAARWRAFIKALHTKIPGPGHGTRIKVVATDPMYGDESDVEDIARLIDGVIAQQSEDQS